MTTNSIQGGCCEKCKFKCSKGYPFTCPCHSPESSSEWEEEIWMLVPELDECKKEILVEKIYTLLASQKESFRRRIMEKGTKLQTFEDRWEIDLKDL